VCVGAGRAVGGENGDYNEIERQLKIGSKGGRGYSPVGRDMARCCCVSMQITTARSKTEIASVWFEDLDPELESRDDSPSSHFRCCRLFSLVSTLSNV